MGYESAFPVNRETCFEWFKNDFKYDFKRDFRTCYTRFFTPEYAFSTYFMANVLHVQSGYH